MKGHVPTPQAVADHIVTKLFKEAPPSEGDQILYPGLGTGPFVAAVERHCETHGYHIPDGVGIESNPKLVAEARDIHADRGVEILERDFLDDVSDLGQFAYIVGNPPYVPIEDLSEGEIRRYKRQFDTAVERFDLYLLFFEQSLGLLQPGGRLSFVTPEKFEYTQTASTLRQMLAEYHIECIEHLPEDTFDGYVTYPTISVIERSSPNETRIIRRDTSESTVNLPDDGTSWAPFIREVSGETLDSDVTLGEITRRISCGMATGRDAIFVKTTNQDAEDSVPPQLVEEGWTYPTISGKQLELNDGVQSDDVIICPYDERGNLVPEDELGVFGEWAKIHRSELESRSCVEAGKAWYSWHENPPMNDIIGCPKLLWKDVAKQPEFWSDPDGEVLPRHSVYYLIPKKHVDLEELRVYLNSDEARAWLEAHCQRASNGFYRLQSTVLKDLPVPESFTHTIQTAL